VLEVDDEGDIARAGAAPHSSREPAATAEPTFTVIIAVRNGAASLQRALDSVFEQTYPRIELVVMDGGSTDGTQAILEHNDARIAYWESAPDRGVCHAWNKALTYATGDWISFLGADDRYHDPQVFEAVAAALPDGTTGPRVVYGKLARLKADGWVYHRGGRPWKQRRKKFRQGEMIPHPSTFHHRSVFEERGGFDEGFAIAGDYEFLLRELPQRKPRFVPVLVADMSPGGLSNRPSTAGRMAKEVYRARYMHHIVKVPPWCSPRLAAQLGQVWLDRHVRPRLRSRTGAPGSNPQHE